MKRKTTVVRWTRWFHRKSYFTFDQLIEDMCVNEKGTDF